MTRLIIVFVLQVCLSPVSKARSNDSACLASLSSRSFVFNAQWAIGRDGIRRQLSPPYYVSISRDSVRAYLPFYGRMYRVPTPQELRFMSIDLQTDYYTYDLQQTKKGARRLTVIPKAHHDVQSLMFHFTNPCFCTLTVRSVGRDPMFYEGFIEGP